MINCINCYRLHRHKDTIYCPFFDLPECVRGAHHIDASKLSFAPAPPKLPPLPPKPVEKNKKDRIPIFKPYEHGSKIDWAKYHNRIFEMHISGVSTYKIADALGLKQYSVHHYIARYVED